MAWDDSNDLNQGGAGSMQRPMAPPTSIAPPQAAVAAASPAAGAGWKQGLQQLGDTAGRIRFGGDGGMSVAPKSAPAQSPIQQQPAAQNSDLASRLMELAKRGLISPAQAAAMAGSQMGATMGMAPPGMAPTHSPSVNGAPPQPIMPQNGVMPPSYGARPSPTGPTSQAWGN